MSLRTSEPIPPLNQLKSGNSSWDGTPTGPSLNLAIELFNAKNTADYKTLLHNANATWGNGSNNVMADSALSNPRLTGPSVAYHAAIRRREVERIKQLFASLSNHASDPNFAAYTFPISEGINRLIGLLATASSEGNTREILRRLRNTILDGGWDHYRDEPSRLQALRALDHLAATEAVTREDIHDVTRMLLDAELHPLGAPLLEFEIGERIDDGTDGLD